jgi:hypothetical protein
MKATQEEGVPAPPRASESPRKPAADRWWRMVPRSPVTGTVTTLLILFAGLLASIHSANIRSHPLGPLAKWMHDGSYLFVITAALGAFLFFWERTANQADSRDARRELDEVTQRLIRETEDLKHLVRTVPPADFLVFFERIYTRLAAVTAATVRAPSDPGEIETLDGSVRAVLGGAGALARKFDLRGSNAARAVYGVNLMVFRPAEDTPAWRALAERCTQRDPAMRTDPQTLSGVLEYIPRLSTRSIDAGEGDQTPGSDSLLSDNCFVLPIPVPELRVDQAGRSRVLPGAPLALVDGIPKLYASIDHFYSDLHNRCGFAADVRVQAETHFERYKDHIQSFLSIPIMEGPEAGGPPEATKPERFLGVLNIHRDQRSLLGEEELAEQFAILALPLKTMLSLLLQKRRKMEMAARALVVDH